MKKFAALLIALMLVLSTAAMAETTPFKMGLDPEFPPFTYLGEDGEYTGFDIEIAQLVCDNLGWELVPTPVNWDNKLIQLNAGEVDCIWSGLTIDNIPADEYTLSAPYIDNTQVIVTLADSGITTLADLAGKIVGVQNGTSAQDLLTDGDQAELGATFAQLPARPGADGAADLQGGAVDAVAIDISIATNLINASDDPSKFAILEEPIASEQYGICFRKADEDMCLQVQRALTTLVEEGTYLEVAEKYAADGIDTNALCLVNEANS